MMTWVNFAMLGVGGLLISVPIVLHFLMQPKPVEMVFPAMRFLIAGRQTNRSKMRVRHFLLLLLRCLLIALVAVALAGPSVASNEFGNWLTLGGIGFSGLIVAGVLAFALYGKSSKRLLVAILIVLLLGHLAYGGWAASKLLTSESTQLLGDAQAPVAALIVIDTSPRMEYVSENSTGLEKAKEAAISLIRQFPPDSQVCVLATDNDRPFFSIDLAAAERRIESLATDYSGASVPNAMVAGLRILKKTTQDRKEVYVVTDLTQQSWVGENPKLLVKQLGKDSGISTFVFDVGVLDATNFSLGPLKLANAEISSRGKLSISTELTRFGPADQRSVKMVIEKRELPLPVIRDGVSRFPGEFIEAQRVTADIREDASVPLKFSFSQRLELGVYHGRIELEGQDGLAVDNQRYFTFRVGETKNALIVHPDGVNPRVMESLLTPRDKVEAGTARYESVTMDQMTFSQLEDWNDYDAIYLLDPSPWEDEVWERLESFVFNGGGLAVFLGHNAANGGIADPSFTTPAAARILSGPLEQQWFNEEPDLFLSPKDLVHPVFDSIRDNESTVLWNRFPVFIHWGIEPGMEDGIPTQTLLRYGNREPAVIERAIGSGRVIVMTTPITEYGFVTQRESWNSLLSGNPVPAFLLLDGIASYLVEGDAESLNVLVAQTAVLNNDLRKFPESYQAFAPDPEKPPTVLNSVDNKIRYRFIDEPGQYRLKGQFDQQIVLRGFSANIGNSVTDLTRIEMDELDAFLGADQYQLATKQEELRRQQGTMRRGKEFYPLIVVLMLVVLAVEYLMSNRFYSK